MSEITFDENGVCKFCKMHDKFVDMHPLNDNQSTQLNGTIAKIKADGRKKEYDCIIGLSGGVDSTYLLYWAVKHGLRPLAVSFDNGWNTEIAVNNIRKATEKLNVDLHTIIADWEEMKDLQRAFILASVSDADAPTDYAIYSIFYKEAIKANVRYSLNGHSFRAEGSVPKSWSYFDGRYVKSVHKRFGSGKRIKSFPLMSMPQFIYYTLFRRIKDVRVFDYIPYNKDEAKKIIFSGDTLFIDGIGRTDLPSGDEKELKRSLERLADLEIEKVYPGHGESGECDINRIIEMWF